MSDGGDIYQTPLVGTARTGLGPVTGFSQSLAAGRSGHGPMPVLSQQPP